MSGRESGAVAAVRSVPEKAGSLLDVDELSVASSSGEGGGRSAVHGVSFSLRVGEILGIYGLLGAGRTEFLEALAGLRPLLSGKIRLKGESLRLNSVVDAVKQGIHLVPEDRQRDGLVPELSIRENIVLAASRGVLLDRREETASALKLVKELNIAASNLELPVTALSGGNQQKVLIARCLMRAPVLLLLDEPTRGVDVGAKAEIYGILRRLANEGIGVIFTSSEIEETQELADRVLVLCQGRIAAEFDRSQLQDESLFAAASPIVTAGATPQQGAMLV